MDLNSLSEPIVIENRLPAPTAHAPREIRARDFRSVFEMLLEKAEIRGEGYVSHPKMTAEDLAAIKQRADTVEDQQIKTDLFRLFLEVERLKEDLEYYVG